MFVVRKLHTASTSPLGATAIFPAPLPKLPSEVSVTRVVQLLPVLTEACRPPDGGMNRTAEVLPLVATATPPPFAMNCGVLQVCATATPEPTTPHAKPALRMLCSTLQYLS